MATQLHHRKLMFNDGIDDDDEQVCAQPCDPAWDHTSFICPLQCFDVCPSICNDDVANNPPAEAGGPKSAVFIVTFLPLMMTIVLIWGCLSIYRWSSQEPQQPPLPHELYGGEFDHRPWYVRTTGGLHSSVINAIAIRRYKKGEGALEESECAVCLSEFEEDEILRMLPNCKHGFHVPCIDTWLKSNTNCPVCRAGVEISTENSDVAPPVPLGIPVNNRGEREDSRAHECMSGVNDKEDESTEQNVVPKNNIIVHNSCLL